MLAEQLALQKRMMRSGGSDPYATDYSTELSGLDIKNEEEEMRDSGPDLGQQKSFSF